MASDRLTCLFALLALSACYASNVVAKTDRSVQVDVDQLAWQPAKEADLTGLFESVEVLGDAALALRKVYYVFVADGTYSGAALVESAAGQQFQTLNGLWRLSAAGLVLDQTAPAMVEAAPLHLRITSTNGILILRHVELH